MTGHVAISNSKFTQNRPHDYLYDPVFTVSDPKDYIREVMIARRLSSKYAVCPIFQSMFSDLPHYPRQTIVRRETRELLNSDVILKNVFEGGRDYLNRGPLKPLDIRGADRCKFFRSPIVQLSPEIIPEREHHIVQKSIEVSYDSKKSKCQKTQTVFRESSAQTQPWKTPHYIIPEGTDPELLKINFLKDSMLPAGVHEIELIKRHRIIRAWEELLKNLSGNDTYEKRRNIIEAIEVDEWIAREEEINDIQNIRMELLEKMLEEILNRSNNKCLTRVTRRTETLQKQKEENVKKIKHQAKRDLRRLHRKHHGIVTKYRKVNVIDEHRDMKSEIYGPQLKFGEDPRRRHENIIISDYPPEFDDIDSDIHTLPIFQNKSFWEEITRPRGRRLCPRDTRWTDPILQKIHDELKHMNDSPHKDSGWNLRVRSEIFDPCPPIEGLTQKEEKDYFNAVFLQSLIRGRTTQIMIFDGRNRCRELINELKSTFHLHEEERIKVVAQREEEHAVQRNFEIAETKYSNLSEILYELEGNIVGTLLDFLNKELRRILDERRAHAVALLAERDRHMKEAAEAGRRQVEERRRREHDEIFKELTKVHQDTVDLYLQEIITEGVEIVSKDQAEQYVKKLAEKIDADYAMEDQNLSGDQETIADMVHHFMIPEVEKETIRKQIQFVQQDYLKAVHIHVYDTLDSMQIGFDDESDVTDTTYGVKTDTYRSSNKY